MTYMRSYEVHYLIPSEADWQLVEGIPVYVLVNIYMRILEYVQLNILYIQSDIICSVIEWSHVPCFKDGTLVLVSVFRGPFLDIMHVH